MSSAPTNERIVVAPPGVGRAAAAATRRGAAGTLGGALTDQGLGRTWSLRREWSRAFAMALTLLLVASIGTYGSVRMLVDHFSGTARQLDRETQTLTSLKGAISDHEIDGLRLLKGDILAPDVFLAQQVAISRQFSTTMRVFAPRGDDLVGKAQIAWQRSLTTAGLWGDQLRSLVAPTDTAVEGKVQIGLQVDTSFAQRTLDNLDGPAVAAMNAGLADGAVLERQLIAALAALFAVALGLTAYFRRRMSKDLVRPVARMHAGVLRLRAGEYDHRIDVARRDELGELAEAFNGMADALHDNHLALTMRATHDSLTGLANRAALTERLTESFHSDGDRRARRESVLFIDIDDFKDVNDSLGHDGGDALLVELAVRLKACVRPHDLLARLGGDEFAIVVVESDRGSIAVEVAERILDALREPFVVNDTQLAVAASIGIAEHADSADAAELLRQADFAMYMAKGGGKGRYQIFDGGMHDSMIGRSALKSDLAAAAHSDQLRLEYQPVVDLRTGEILGVEALVRWQHPTLGLLPPAEFIPLAEETGAIDAIGCWVLQTAGRQVRQWRTMDLCEDLWVAVNLSAFQLLNPSSRDALQRILADPAVDATKIVLEITETALAADIEGGITSLNALKSTGIRIAIDDFGTGFSSLSTLARLPVDILKIDGSFVSGTGSVAAAGPMLEGILGLADKLSLTVIAEGIEQADQLDLLRDLRCSLGQGYLLARPLAPAALEELLAAGGLLPVSVVVG
jgi:diguanylate cyclase (GGDEF)-like protein